jgi:alkaline phosphatase D
MEFACGPGSNEHASGWDKNNILPEHRYLNIVGGFLDVEIIPEGDGTRIVFTHYGVDGDKLHREEFTAV